MERWLWPKGKNFDACLFFTLAPISTIVAMYFLNGTLRLVFLYFGIFLLLWFLFFLWTYRRKELGSTMAIIPTILGPLLSNSYVKIQMKDLYIIQSNGGDTLVQLSFFFSGIIGLIIYLSQRLSDPKQKSRKDLVSFLMLAVILIAMAVLGPHFVNYEVLPSNNFLPAVTLLFGSRVLLVLYVVVIASWPSTDQEPTYA